MGIRRFVATAVAGAALTALLAVPARAEAPALPTSIAALGDSISLGFNACGFYVACTRRSWSTGDDGGVDSHRLRLREEGVVLREQSNLAKFGADSAALPDQARRAVALGVQYVTIEIGANDACAGTEREMTSIEDYRARVTEALAILREGLPGARVFVASVPDLRWLWFQGRGLALARKAWSKFGICQSMLARPNSFAPVDADRRNRVRTRVVMYNDALEKACAAYGPQCRYDGEAVFFAAFPRAQISKWDYFHPSEAGQAALADITWRKGFFSF